MSSIIREFEQRRKEEIAAIAEARMKNREQPHRMRLVAAALGVSIVAGIGVAVVAEDKIPASFSIDSSSNS